MTRDLWMSGQFSNHIARGFWMKLTSSLTTSMTNNDVVRKSYQSVLKLFFSKFTPSVPGLQRVEFENDTILSSEFPPNPPEIGRIIDEDESSFRRPNYNWKNRKEIALLLGNGEIEFKIGQPPIPTSNSSVKKVTFDENQNIEEDENQNNEKDENNLESTNASFAFSPMVLRENSILTIKHCEVVNARMNFQSGEIAPSGSKFVDLYVYE